MRTIRMFCSGKIGTCIFRFPAKRKNLKTKKGHRSIRLSNQQSIFCSPSYERLLFSKYQSRGNTLRVR